MKRELLISDILLDAKTTGNQVLVQKKNNNSLSYIPLNAFVKTSFIEKILSFIGIS